jgi:hypothetical protein
MVSDTAGQALYLFGGRDLSACRNDLWRFEPASAAWTRVTVAEGPQARSGAGLAWDSDRGRLVLFGGYCSDEIGDNEFFQDLWFWQPDAGWKQEFTTDGPSARAWHSMAVEGPRMFVFGGTSPAPLYHRNDIWELDLETLTWKRLATDGGPLQAGRALLVVGSDGQSPQVFGREGIPKPDRAGRWALDLAGDQWDRLEQGSHSAGLPPTDYHLALFVADRFLILQGPAEQRPGWRLWTSPSNQQQTWNLAELEGGPEQPIGMACTRQSGETHSAWCFGGVLRDALSAQTWKLTSRRSADHRPGESP